MHFISTPSFNFSGTIHEIPFRQPFTLVIRSAFRAKVVLRVHFTSAIIRRHILHSNLRGVAMLFFFIQHFHLTSTTHRWKCWGCDISAPGKAVATTAAWQRVQIERKINDAGCTRVCIFR